MADVWDISLLLLVYGMIIVCPYNKVEESFNTQATHDILVYGTQFDKYDHIEFPGVVPRTFLGPAVVSTIAYPFHVLLQTCQAPLMLSQVLIRMVLGTLLVWSISQFRKQITKSFDKQISVATAIVTLSQFHIPFYMSRTLPNTFALFLVIQGYTAWFQRNYRKTAFLFTLTIIIFRSEVVVLLGPIMLEALIRRELGFFRMIYWGILSAIFSLVLSIATDSIFWEPGMWAEGVVFYYNAILGKSVNWGTSPYYWYFTNAIPKALGFTALFIPFSLNDGKVRRIVRPIILFVLLYSFLPHKELRFIFYVFPILNVAAAVGFVNVWRRAPKFFKFLAIGLFVAMFLYSSGLLYISANNYPGGQAFRLLHHKYSHLEGKEIYIHIDTAAAQTGVSRFGEEFRANWRL